MNRNWINIIVLLSALAFSGCEGDLFHDCLSGRGSTTTVRRGLFAFGNVAAYDNIQLTIEQGNEYSVTITSGHKLIPMITTLIVNNTLEIRNDSRCELLKDPWKPVEVLLKVPVLDSVFIMTQAKVRVNGVVGGNNFFVEATETSADIEITLNNRYFRLDFLKGTADINITGYSDTIFIYSVAAGKVDARSGYSDVMVVNTGSMNDIYVRAGKKLLDVYIQNIGNVYYTTDPAEIVFYSTNTGKLLLLN